MTDAILTLNAGSSSLKFALFSIEDKTKPALLAGGLIEGMGTAPHFLAHDKDGCMIAEQRWEKDTGFETLLSALLSWTDTHHEGAVLAAVGHRVVHGGRNYAGPVQLDRTILAALAALTPLAPLHQGHCLAPIEALMRLRADLPQVACFDTAFHHGMPELAVWFALPERYHAEGVRRYGFHGLSYAHIVHRLKEIDPVLARRRVIAAHLGNGASLCALVAGKSQDTTMGFTALDGLMMGTRCGAIDPGVLLYMIQHERLSGQEIEDLLYRRSGLLGVSGLSNDVRDLLASDHPAAKTAIALFAYQAARQFAAMAGALGGVDGVVFTAGIGEHSPEIRALICARLGWLGVTLDPEANAAGRNLISATDSPVRVWVIAADEEATILRQTLDVIQGRRAPVIG